MFAIVLALLLLCSLWKKRRALFCPRWNSTSNNRAPSELDSTGSCYAPPHYSRCSSFYHAPPPYQEVTSKPDMYPLVFSYTSDGSKNGNGANYLMVQYFRNYIVRPIGSLSATSTVDSLSSSFICTANEANTMIPPPYSSANSPDALSISLQNYTLPRSASQQGCSLDAAKTQSESRYGTENVSFTNRPMSVPNTKNHAKNSSHHFRASESANFVDLYRRENETEGRILVHQTPHSTNSTASIQTASSRSRHQNTISDDDDDDFQLASSNHEFSLGNAAAGLSFDGNQASNIYHSNDTMLSLSAAMMEKISYSQQTNDHTKLNMIQKQLEKCCEMIQQQQQQIQQTRSHFEGFESEPSISCELAKKMSESAMMGLNFMTSNTGSTVSSLANLNSPSSPPQATSPTQEVKDLLEQISQLKVSNLSDEDLGKPSNGPKPGPSTSRNPPFKRPTSFSSKRRFFNMNNRSVYLPVAASPTALVSKLRSPSSAIPNVFIGKSRCMRNRTGWVSKSAPTTPGTGFPSSFISDHSPLLNEQDEDVENDQNC